MSMGFRCDLCGEHGAPAFRTPHKDCAQREAIKTAIASLKRADDLLASDSHAGDKEGHVEDALSGLSAVFDWKPPVAIDVAA